MNPNEQPAAAPQPAPQAPAAPAPAPEFTPGVSNAPYLQPAADPVPNNPIADQPAPEAPQTPQTPAPQPEAPQNPTEPNAPIQTQPEAPAAPAVPAENKQQQTYDEYLESLVKDIKPVEVPKPAEVDQNDPEGLNKFFEAYGRSMVEQAKQEMQKESIIQSAEARAWTEVFTKYPEIQNNTGLRDTIHNIRMGAYSRGQSLSPLEVADGLVGTLHTEYKKGVNDTNVQVRVQDSQPLNGGGTTPAAPKVNYQALQDGGTNEAVNQIQQMIDAGLI